MHALVYYRVLTTWIRTNSERMSVNYYFIASLAAFTNHSFYRLVDLFLQWLWTS